jgi:cystathionine beta-lyase
MTALAGAVTGGASAVATRKALAVEPPADVFDFDTPYDRVGTNSVKYDRQIERFGEKFKIGMGIADMDFRAAPCITRALAERCAHENWGYMNAPKSYIESIVQWNQRRYDLEIDPDSIEIANGVHPALIGALRTFTTPGTRVLMTPPIYSAFYSLDLRVTSTLPQNSPMLWNEGRYSIDWDYLESAITHDTNVLILCNPQNPTGNCWSKEDLLRLGQLCLERRVVVLSDEIHCDFVTKGNKYTPFASLSDKDVVNNSVTFKAASKSFSLAAMKTAYFFSTNPEFMERIKTNHRADINTLGVVANEAAYREGDAWLDQLLVYIDGNHDFAESYVRARIPLMSYTKPEGTYLGWLNVSKVLEKIGAEEIAAEEAKKQDPSEAPVTAEIVFERWLVEKSGVQLNPGSGYGPGGTGHMRMNIATSRQTLEAALDAIASAVASL